MLNACLHASFNPFVLVLIQGDQPAQMLLAWLPTQNSREKTEKRKNHGDHNSWSFVAAVKKFMRARDNAPCSANLVNMVCRVFLPFLIRPPSFHPINYFESFSLWFFCVDSARANMDVFAQRFSLSSLCMYMPVCCYYNSIQNSLTYNERFPGVRFRERFVRYRFTAWKITYHKTRTNTLIRTHTHSQKHCRLREIVISYNKLIRRCFYSVTCMLSRFPVGSHVDRARCSQTDYKTTYFLLVWDGTQMCIWHFHSNYSKKCC